MLLIENRLIWLPSYTLGMVPNIMLNAHTGLAWETSFG